ncbi:MAG: aspartate 1-decarboxylase [Anaerolineales bacterium]
MQRKLLIGKIHRAVVTGANVNYVGSITLDPVLMQAAGILPWELVQVVDVENGARLETYVIPGEPESGAVQLNGAAARLVQPGDHVIVMNYAWMDAEEIAAHRPRAVFVDEHNRITEIRHLPTALQATPQHVA